MRAQELRFDLLEADRKAVTEAMQYLTNEERKILVALAKSYEEERADKPASEIFGRSE